MSYAEGLVYLSRPGSEHEALRERIDASLRDDEARLEVEMVRKTMAQVEGERYVLEAKKETLVELLRLRWGPLPAETEHAIQSTMDAGRVAEWLRRFATAADLDSVGIVPPA